MNSPRTFNRRQFLLGTAGAIAAALVPAPALMRYAGAVVDIYSVVSGPLNLRSGPGLKYSVIASLPVGTRMEIIDTGGTADGYTWVKVWVGSLDKTGFVAREFIAKAPLLDGTVFPVGSSVVTTAAVNLRSGAGLGYSVIVTLWQGAPLTITGAPVAADGYNWYPVRTGYGTTGWVAGAFLTDSTPSTPVITGTRKTTANVNLRSGPGTNYQVLRVVPFGSIVQSSDTVQNGFRYVVHQGLGGWMADSYLVVVTGTGPVPDYQTTTANLNLREEPSLSARVLLVIPAGSRVIPTGEMAYGFAKVTYNGTTGWAHTDYLI